MQFQQRRSDPASHGRRLALPLLAPRQPVIAGVGTWPEARSPGSRDGGEPHRGRHEAADGRQRVRLVARLAAPDLMVTWPCKASRAARRSGLPRSRAALPRLPHSRRPSARHCPGGGERPDHAQGRAGLAAHVADAARAHGPDLADRTARPRDIRDLVKLTLRRRVRASCPARSRPGRSPRRSP